jgi:hypothetical protein
MLNNPESGRALIAGDAQHKRTCGCVGEPDDMAGTA